MPGSPVVDIQTSFGATFIGLLVSTTLWGLTLAQTWMYFWHYYNRDSRALKLFIAFISVVDAIHTILTAYMNYWYLVLNFGNVDNLNVSIWALHVQVILSVIVGTAVQLFYARRVYKVGQRIIFPILIVACTVIASCLGVLYTAREIVANLFSKLAALTWISATALSAGALSDLLIAGSMCWYLYQKRTGFARTDSIIMTLMTYSINSGLLTSVLGTATTITIAVLPNSLISLALFWTLTKCYVNSLLAMLNSRDHVRDRSTTDNPDNAFNLSSIRIDPMTRSDTPGFKSRQPSVSVTVHHSSTTSDFGPKKSDHDVEPAFEIRKADTSIIPLQIGGQTSESSA